MRRGAAVLRTFRLVSFRLFLVRFPFMSHGPLSNRAWISSRTLTVAKDVRESETA
jgi:hypothetical protein